MSIFINKNIMIKNYNFNISEEEKRQILNLHESRTKRHYLINEQSDVYNPTIEQAKEFLDRLNAFKAKYPNSKVFKDVKYMNKVQIATNKINGGQNPAKPIQSQQTQTNNNPFRKYIEQAQTALGVPVDGKFGPKTLEALKAKLTPTNVTTPPPDNTVADKAAADKLEKENAFKASVEKTIADNKALKGKGMAFPWSKESVASPEADKAAADKAAADKLASEKMIANKYGINKPNSTEIVIPPQEVKQPPLGSGGFKGMSKPTKF